MLLLLLLLIGSEQQCRNEKISNITQFVVGSVLELKCLLVLLVLLLLTVEYGCDGSNAIGNKEPSSMMMMMMMNSTTTTTK